MNTRPPASAAPVDELVETTSRSATLTARSIANHIRDHKDDPHLANIIIWLCDSLDEAADQLTVYARRVAELEGALKLFADVATAYEENGYDDSKKLYFTMKELKDARAALTGEKG